MKKQTTVVAITLSLLLMMNGLFAQEKKTITKDFKNIEILEIELVSGDCEIKAGDDKTVTVQVEYDVKPAENFRPEFDHQNKTLALSEDWSGGSSRGNVLWTITAPAETEIDFVAVSGDLSIENMNSTIEVKTASGDIKLAAGKGEVEVETASGDINVEDMNGELELGTASGDILIENSKGKIEMSTASGDIEAKNLEGDFELEVASGDIEIEESEGKFKCSTASGDLDASGVILTGNSKFSVASGDINVVLADSPKHDLEISAASGDATLDYNGHKITGTIEMTARKIQGKIRAPFKADRTATFEKYNDEYVRNTYNRGNDPMITIETVSGDVILKK